MFRFIFLNIFFVLYISSVAAQQTDTSLLRQKEMELKKFSDQMIFAPEAMDRFKSNTDFIKNLVKVLETPFSFQYPFDSLQTVSIENAPDKTFRIFTWELQKDDNYFRQYGAIQMNTADGKLKIFPLFDVSEFTEKPFDSIRTNKQWIGALYYKILKNSYKGKDYYTLLGLDDNDFLTTKKWIDILTFDTKGEPQFGAPIFQYVYDTIKVEQPVDRFLLEYKKDAKARMNYDEELKAIVFDHLISEDNKPWQKTTLIPGGLYEGFVWKNGIWTHVKDMFVNDPESKTAPIPHPKEDNGLF